MSLAVAVSRPASACAAVAAFLPAGVTGVAVLEVAGADLRWPLAGRRAPRPAP